MFISAKEQSVEEQRVQKSDRFSRGGQIAYMIYEHFRATGAYEAVQGLSDFFTISSQNDNVQDTDVRRDHALSSVEGLYKSRLQNSAQLQTVLALYDQETARNRRPNYQQLKTVVKFLVDTDDENSETSGFGNQVVERGSVTKSQKGKKAYD